MYTGFYKINFSVFNNPKFDIEFEVLERNEQNMKYERNPMTTVYNKNEEDEEAELVCVTRLKVCVVEFFKYKNFFNAIIEFSKNNPHFMISITEQEQYNIFSIKDPTTGETEEVLQFSIVEHQSFENMFKVIHNHLFNNE